MSLLLDALRSTDETRRQTNPAPTGLDVPAFELEPHVPSAAAAEEAPARTAPPSDLTLGNTGHHLLPDWRLTSLFSGVGATLAGIWLALAPAAIPINPVHAAPPPLLQANAAALEDESDSTPPPATTRHAPALVEATTPVREPRRPPPPATDTPRFRPTVPAKPPSSSPLVLAYDAYIIGNLTRAGFFYRQALTSDPNNADALNGLAAIALQQRRLTEADTLFRRALQARPVDPTALAGLARLAAGNGTAAESQLKDTIAALGDAPASLAPRLALADLLARQQRWAEAQQQYFDAHRLAPADADIAYNLAISLDRLGQPRLAARHYRQALTLAAAQPEAATRFSRTRCAERLTVLQPFESPP